MSFFRISTNIIKNFHTNNLQNILKKTSSLNVVGQRFLASKTTTTTREPTTYEFTNERQYEDLKVDKYQELFTKNQSLKKNVEHILGMYEHQKYTSSEVPITITLKEMSDLLKIFPNEKELHRGIKFLYIKECKRYNSKLKKTTKKLENIEKKRERYGHDNLAPNGEQNPREDAESLWQHGIWNSEGTELVYGLWHNALLSRITKQSVRSLRHNHMQRAGAMFGQKLIIDLDYDNYMQLYEARLLASQLGILFYENRLNRDYPEALPFDVHFTNCSNAPNTMEAMPKHMKKFDDLSGHFHSGSYLELQNLFPRERLVYLSPHAQGSLREYRHDDIYILGGYNDRSSHQQVSHIKAQSEGLRCVRLPLDENVLWRQGNKNLCLNQVAAILHAVKVTGNWRDAIQRYAPQRKIKSGEELALEDEIRVKQMQRRVKNIQKSFSIKKS